METKKYGTVPLVVCIRVPVRWIKEQEVKLLKSKLKSLRISKEELIDQFDGQAQSEMEDHFREGELNTYLQEI